MKKLNKLLAIILAVAMIMSLAVTAGATAGSGYTITITNAVVGQTYSAYKIFDAKSDGSSSYSYTISENSQFIDLIKKYSNLNTTSGKTETEYFKLTASVSDPDTYVVEPTTALIDANGVAVEGAAAELAAIIKAAIEDVSSSYSYAAQAEATGTNSGDRTSLTLDVGAPGYYFVDTTLGALTALGTTVGNAAEVTEKNDVPSVDKQISDDGSDNSYSDNATNAAIGDKVYYQTTISNIYGNTKLTLHDAMEDGLTLDENSIVVYLAIDGSTLGTALTASQDYTLITGVDITQTGHDQTEFDGTCDFEIVLDAILASQASNITSSSVIVVQYEATINSDAEIYSNSNDNDTYINYGDNSYSTVDKVRTYVYELNIHKFYYNSNVATNLTGAGFKLYYYAGNDTTTTPIYVQTESTGTDGEYKVTGDADDKDSAIELFVDDSGNLVITGLDADIDYYLTETTTPTGYNPLTEDIEIDIIPAGETDAGKVTYTGNSNASETVEVENKTGTPMPSTGGIGTTIFYVVGGILVVGAIVLLITKKRLGSEEDK